MKITAINKPMKRCTQWWGTAIDGDKNYEWFYQPRRWLHMREEDPGIPGCFMNVNPPPPAKQAVLTAIRAAKGV